MLPDLREAARQTPKDLGMYEAERPRELKRKRIEVDEKQSLQRAGARARSSTATVVELKYRFGSQGR